MNKPRTGFSFTSTLIAAAVYMATVCPADQPHLSAERLKAIKPIDASVAPLFGNFIFAKGLNTNLHLPPLPGIPPLLRSLNVPIYPLGSNWFLIDDSSVDYAAITETKQMEQALKALEGVPGAKENDAGTESLSYPAGSLWLELAMTNDATYGTMAAITLNGTTNDTWYEILSKRSLADAGWWSEGSLQGFTNQTASQVDITADTSSGTAFLWARSLTNGLEGTLPIWWQLQNFGRTGLDPDSSPGGDGISLVQSYGNGTEPNLIEFSVTATNNYFRANPASVQLEVAGGIPFYRAVLLDNTNFISGAWTRYTSTNLEVGLGSTEGWHDVWIGLKGFSTNSHETWEWKRLKLDSMPPQLALLSPAEGVVTRPTIQVIGTCSEALSAIWYDLSNSAGVLANQQVLILDQYQDTNSWELTTNTFQAFDLRLGNGANLVTLHATDLAGNQSVTNFIFTLDYSDATNPPSIELAWPQDGGQIAADSYTLHGWTDDPTVTVRLQTTGSNGIPRTFCGLVERTGTFWVDNVSLAAGTNVVTLTLTNAAGRSSSRVLSLVRTHLLLTMNPVLPASLLWQPTLTVTGTISDPVYAVWINGVKATNPGDGTWMATSVPVTAGNVAVFQMKAYSPDEEQPDGSHGN